METSHIWISSACFSVSVFLSSPHCRTSSEPSDFLSDLLNHSHCASRLEPQVQTVDDPPPKNGGGREPLWVFFILFYFCSLCLFPGVAPDCMSHCRKTRFQGRAEGSSPSPDEFTKNGARRPSSVLCPLIPSNPFTPSRRRPASLVDELPPESSGTLQPVYSK